MKKFRTKLWNGWKVFALKLGFVNEHIILGLVFFLVIGIYAIPAKFFRLFYRKKTTTWRNFADNPTDLESLKRQF